MPEELLTPDYSVGYARVGTHALSNKLRGWSTTLGTGIGQHLAPELLKELDCNWVLTHGKTSDFT